MTDHTFEAFGFAEPISRALTQREYTTPTPIQIEGLPPQLQGRDLMALAETGSGKTAAFLLPILQRIAANPVELAWKQVGALILAPTRELALQIDAEAASLSRNMNIRRAVVLGGVSKGPQINALKRGVHILVATPGRLLDHVNMRSCDLSGVQTLVLDEADRMFDMGFIRDIKKIASMIPHKRRTAMFSATMPPEIRNFAKELLTEPVFVDLQPKTMVVDRIDQKVMIVRTPEKQSRLHTILADPACTRVIVFTRTKRGADRVTERLAMAGIGAIAIHGNKAQNARQRALADFTQGHVRVLVATDIAARGIDVSDISHVINYEMPVDAETYVHRIGRTARKGLSGIAISLCDPSERPEIKAIERLMKQPIEVIGDVGGEVLPVPEKRPHHAHDAPRREGSHRKGPTGRGPGAEGHRKGGFRKPDGEGRDSFRKEARPERTSDRGADRAPARSFEPRGEAVTSFDPINTARTAERAPRPDFKRAEFVAPDAKRPKLNALTQSAMKIAVQTALVKRGAMASANSNRAVPARTAIEIMVVKVAVKIANAQNAALANGLLTAPATKHNVTTRPATTARAKNVHDTRARVRKASASNARIVQQTRAPVTPSIAAQIAHAPTVRTAANRTPAIARNTPASRQESVAATTKAASAKAVTAKTGTASVRQNS